MDVKLEPHQVKAIKEMKNGCILKGGVGVGKSHTAIGYFFLKVAQGHFTNGGTGKVLPFKTPKDLYILTTAKKRDDLDWEGVCLQFGLGRDPEVSFGGVKVTVDSWNNVNRYVDVKDAFFIFDEQRVVGSGAWSKSFMKISKANEWVLLSATPGDTWMDYIPVFVANGFYKNPTEFKQNHVIWNRFAKFPKVDRFVDTGKLIRYRRSIEVEMPYSRHTKRHLRTLPVDFDPVLLEKVEKKRWHIYEDRPIRDIGELYLVMRKLVNSDPSRLDAIAKIHEKHPRLIIFYNHNHELDRLRTMVDRLGVPVAEWNGHKHQEIPDTDSWLYLVQYTAGSEGWNCVLTDATVFYSLTYSYKQFEQAQGRIDRMNTKYTDLYYYILRSRSTIDGSVWKSLMGKKSFNEKRDYKGPAFPDIKDEIIN